MGIMGPSAQLDSVWGGHTGLHTPLELARFERLALFLISFTFTCLLEPHTLGGGHFQAL